MVRMTRIHWALLLSLFCFPVSASGQQSPTYDQEYDLYQKANAATESVQRKSLVLEFVRKFQKSELDPNISYLYAQYLDEFRKKGAWEQLAAQAEEFLNYRPTDTYAAAAATEAYQKLGRPQKLAEFGARLYQQKPSASAAYLVAKAYRSMNDLVNFKKWAELTLKHDPGNTEMLLEMVNMYWQMQDLAKAAEVSSRVLKSLEGKETNPQLDETKAFCYRAIGENAFRTSDFSTALSSFTESAKLFPKNDFTHFRLGHCQWRLGKIDEAIMSLARAYVLRGSTSPQARDDLYNLYRQRYNNTAGVAKIINAAKTELGVTG